MSKKKRMSRIVVSGASGDLGRRITSHLLTCVAPGNLTLTTRTPDLLCGQTAQGVRVCRADYNDPAALEAAYHDNDVLMLISSMDVTRRVPEHCNAIEAAVRAGVKHIVYTSTCGIHPANPTLSAGDHIITEQILRDSGLGYTIFRNACYAEVISENIAPAAIATGKWIQLEGVARLAPVWKDDIARCAATVLTDTVRHNGAVYEISGPEVLSFQDMAALVSDVHGAPIEYVPITLEELQASFDAAGVPRFYSDDMPSHPEFHRWASDEMVSAQLGFAQGFHHILTGHVELITGEPPRSLRKLLEAYRDHA